MGLLSCFNLVYSKGSFPLSQLIQKLQQTKSLLPMQFAGIMMPIFCFYLMMPYNLIIRRDVKFLKLDISWFYY